MPNEKAASPKGQPNISTEGYSFLLRQGTYNLDLLGERKLFSETVKTKSEKHRGSIL